MARFKGKFKTHLDGFRAAKRFHFCTYCRNHETIKFTECPTCGMKGTRVYFPSEAEMKRAAQLLLKQDQGTIERLRFHPRYDLVVNQRHICQYVADAEYLLDDGRTVVYEDTKPKEWADDLALFKISLFEALYGVTVTIPQRQKKRSQNHETPEKDQ